MNRAIGRRILFKEALAPIEARYATSPNSSKKLVALKAFSDRVTVDGAPIRARLEHPVIAARYWWHENAILNDPQKLSSSTPIGIFEDIGKARKELHTNRGTVQAIFASIPSFVTGIGLIVVGAHANAAAFAFLLGFITYQHIQYSRENIGFKVSKIYVDELFEVCRQDLQELDALLVNR